MKHIPRLMTKDEILEIEKAYSFIQQEKAKGFHISIDSNVQQAVRDNLFDKIPHLIANIKELQSMLDEGGC